MTFAALILTAALTMMPAPQQGGTVLPLLLELEDQVVAELVTPAPAPVIDFDAAMAAAVDEILQERDPETGQFVAAEDNGTGYFGMMTENSYDPAVLAFFAASAIEMYTASDLRNQCEASTVITCSDPWPNTVQQDALITGGVYAGVTALQRLAKTQWDVELDEGWKNVLIWGGIAAVRGLLSAQNISDANALREFGR